MKSRNILILALIMALITTFLFNNYLKELDKKYKKEQNKVSVVVAKTQINKNQKITNEMIEVKELSEDAVHPQAFKKLEDVVGKYAIADFTQGEVLLSFRFTNEFEEKQLLTRKIREGYRAVSVEVNFVESVSNFIEPEDYVDVVFSESFKEGTKNDVKTQLILEEIRVLAVGSRLNEKDTSLKENKEVKQGEQSIEYTAVTLELRAEDAVKLINNDERGNVKLILRSKFISN